MPFYSCSPASSSSQSVPSACAASLIHRRLIVYAFALSGRYANVNTISIAAPVVATTAWWVATTAMVTSGRRWLYLQRHSARTLADWPILAGGTSPQSCGRGDASIQDGRVSVSCSISRSASGSPASWYRTPVGERLISVGIPTLIRKAGSQLLLSQGDPTVQTGAGQNIATFFLTATFNGMSEILYTGFAPFPARPRIKGTACSLIRP